MTSPSHPSDAKTLPDLLRMQVRRAYPLDSIAEVATKIGLSRHSLMAWTTGNRTPGPATLRDVLKRLGADEGTILSALMMLATRGGQ